MLRPRGGSVVFLSVSGPIQSHCPAESLRVPFFPVFVVQSLSHVGPFVTPWTAAHQASLSFIISWSLLKLLSIESMVLSNHLILCCPLLLLPSTFPNIRVFHLGVDSFVQQTEVGV